MYHFLWVGGWLLTSQKEAFPQPCLNEDERRTPSKRHMLTLSKADTKARIRKGRQSCFDFKREETGVCVCLLFTWAAFFSWNQGLIQKGNSIMSA